MGVIAFYGSKSERRLPILFCGRSRFGNWQRAELVIGTHETAGRSHHAHQNADSRPGIVSLSRESDLSVLLSRKPGVAAGTEGSDGRREIAGRIARRQEPFVDALDDRLRADPLAVVRCADPVVIGTRCFRRWIRPTRRVPARR